jgi:serine/threonine-protein kinase RsbW
MPGSADRSQPATHTLRVPADLGRLAEVRDLVRAAADEAGATAACTADMVQAVDEATTNTIIHGLSGGTGWVEVAATTRDDRFMVTIADNAPAFDPTTVPAPDLSVHPAERRPGGMGVLLARLCVDEMTYRPRPGGGNILTLVRKFDRNGKEDR